MARRIAHPVVAVARAMDSRFRGNDVVTLGVLMARVVDSRFRGNDGVALGVLGQGQWITAFAGMTGLFWDC